MGVIAVYDSGIGGLTVLYRLVQNFPKEEFVYFGDNARMPYGKRTQQEILSLAKETLVYLSSFSPTAVVLACNTLTECALPHLSPDLPVVGVSPSAFLQYAFPKPTAVLATRLTASALQNALPPWCRLFVPENLAGEIERDVVSLTNGNLKDLLKGLSLERFSRLHFGCTHYCWLKRGIEKAYPHLEVTDAISKTVALVKTLLKPQERGKGKEEKDGFLSSARLHPPVHFVGESAIKNQNTYLYLIEQMFENGKNLPV